MLTPEDYEEIRRLAEYYRVKVIFEPLTNCSGMTDKDTIYIDNSGQYSKSFFLGIFFHELGHVYCYRNNIWKTYHSPRLNRKRKNAIQIVRTGLKAERWVERWGAKEMKKWYPRRKYIDLYNTVDGRKWFHQNTLPYFKHRAKIQRLNQRLQQLQSLLDSI